MSGLKFQDLLFTTAEGVPLPRTRPHAIIDADPFARRVICDGEGYGGNVRDIYETMRLPLHLWPRGTYFPWRALHPLLERNPKHEP